MKLRTISACVSTALFISLSTSNVFADVVTQVTVRPSPPLDSDTILWDVPATKLCPIVPEDLSLCPGSEFYGYLTGAIGTPNVTAINGTELAVSHLIDPDFEIIRDLPNYYYFRDANFVDGEYLLSTFAYNDYISGGDGYNNNENPVTFIFSDNNVKSICGFGTQIAPFDLGEFKANIQAFDDGGLMGSAFEVTGSDGDSSAAFIGLRSTSPMTSVEIVVTSTGDTAGLIASWYAVNQVTLTYCSDLVPALTLEKTSDVATYSAIDDVINYSYLVTSSGSGTVVGPITVDDDKVDVDCPDVSTVGNEDADLDPEETLICTASYMVDASDITNGSITNKATASGDAGTTSSSEQELTVNYLEPVAPAFTCEGFASPMNRNLVKAKKNRVFPLKMNLFDGMTEQTDGQLAAAPVVTVDRLPTTEDSGAEDIDALSAGHGSDGNQFDFTDDGIWQFNLKSKGLASGTYVVTVTSGDPLEYTIEAPTCETSFIIK